MNVKKNFHIIRKDEGSGLILTLLTLMVISILGAALGTITVGSYNLGDVNRDDNSAYYIAEAGANMAYEEFNAFVNKSYTDYNDPSTFFNEIYNFITLDIHTSSPKIQKEYTDEFSFQFGSQPKAIIEVTQNMEGNSRDYTITSTGIVEGKERTVTKDVTVTWIDKSNNGPGSAIPDITTTVAKNSISIGNNVTITGTLHLDSNKPGSLHISKEVETDSEDSVTGMPDELNVYVHPEADVNETLSQSSKKDINVNITNRAATLNWEVYDELINDFPTFPEKSDPVFSNWIINAEGLNKVFVVDSLPSNISILGDGRVDIYVRNKIELANDASINKTGDTDQLQVFYKGTDPVKLGNKAHYNGTLFAKESNFEFGNNLTLTGLFITGGLKVSLGGGNLNTLLIAPKATLTYANSSDNNSIRGIMVGSDIELLNNLTLVFDNYYLKNFPLRLPDPGSEGDGTGEGGSGSDEGELIITKPGVEN